MTRDQISTEILERLNLSSTTAIARVNREIQDLYGQVLASLGLQTSTRTTVTATASIGNPLLTFTANKLLNVFNAAVTPVVVLQEITPDEWRNYPLMSDPPTVYAVWNQLATTVTIKVNTTPTTAFVLSADVEANAATLSGSTVPVFPVDYHDLLVHGVMVIELDKMEKDGRAAAHQLIFDRRMAELRYFLSKSAYLRQYQNKDSGWWPWPLVQA